MSSWYKMKFLAYNVIFLTDLCILKRFRQSLRVHRESFMWNTWMAFSDLEKLFWVMWKTWTEIGWLFLHSAWFEAAGRTRSTRAVFVQVNISVCLRLKWLSCLPGGTWGGLTGERERERGREQGRRLKEWRDYPHTVDWSLKRSCSVQLGSTSLRRTWHR